MADEETLANGVTNITLDDAPAVEPAVAKSDDSDGKHKIESLLAEIESLKASGAEAKRLLDEKERESDRSEDDRRALHSISSRAADLETEVSRLQHDLISVVSENEDLSREIAELKAELERKAAAIASLRVEKEQFDREKAVLHEKVKKSEADAEEYRQATLNGGDDVSVTERESTPKGLKGVKVPGTALVAAGTVVAVAAVIYIGYSRKR